MGSAASHPLVRDPFFEHPWMPFMVAGDQDSGKSNLEILNPGCLGQPTGHQTHDSAITNPLSIPLAGPGYILGVARDHGLSPISATTGEQDRSKPELLVDYGMLGTLSSRPLAS